MAVAWRGIQHRVNGLVLHWVEAGPATGPLVILLHGFPEFWWAWRHQITPLAKQGYRVVALDMRGYNLSEAPEGIPAYRLDRLVSDIVALADFHQAGRFYLVGHDWGGIVAWSVAASHPERLERLAIMSAPHPGQGLWKSALKHPSQMIRSSYVALFQLPWLPEAALKKLEFASLRATLKASSRPATFCASDLQRYVGAWSRPGKLTAMLNYYRALRQRSTYQSPERIKPPVLILWGEKDTFLERHLAQSALKLCNDGHLEIVGQTTHWLHLEAPDRVTSLLKQFIG